MFKKKAATIEWQYYMQSFLQVGNGEAHDNILFVGIQSCSLVLIVFCINIHGQNKGIRNALKTKLWKTTCRKATETSSHLHVRFNLFLCYRAGQIVLVSSSVSVSPTYVCIFSRMYGSFILYLLGRQWSSLQDSRQILPCPCLLSMSSAMPLPQEKCMGSQGRWQRWDRDEGGRLSKTTVDEGRGVTITVWGNGKAPARW